MYKELSLSGNTWVRQKLQLTLSQLLFLTACQQLLLHTCDWLGLKRLGISTIVSRTVMFLSLPSDASTICYNHTADTQSEILCSTHNAILDSMVNELNCALLYTGLDFRGKHTAAQSHLGHISFGYGFFPVRWCRMSDPKTLPTWSWTDTAFNQRWYVNKIDHLWNTLLKPTVLEHHIRISFVY